MKWWEKWSQEFFSFSTKYCWLLVSMILSVQKDDKSSNMQRVQYMQYLLKTCINQSAIYVYSLHDGLQPLIYAWQKGPPSTKTHN